MVYRIDSGRILSALTKKRRKNCIYYTTNKKTFPGCRGTFRNIKKKRSVSRIVLQLGVGIQRALRNIEQYAMVSVGNMTEP